MIIGMDPGLKGGIAAIKGGKVVDCAIMPVMAKTYGKGNQVNAAKLTSILMEMKAGEEDVEVYIEQVGSRPGQGVVSMFSFGDSFGVLRGVCAALQLPIQYVTPNKWENRAGLKNKEKDAARTMAINEHPEVSHKLIRKTVDGGVADAILIAKYGYK